MSKQLHKNFTDDQVKSLLEKYSKGEIKLNYILQMLRIKKSRFFELLTKYRNDSDNFSIQYERNTSNYRIDREIEANIVKELKIEKDLIKNKDVPIKYYNYSYIKDLLGQKYDQKVTFSKVIDTIIYIIQIHLQHCRINKIFYDCLVKHNFTVLVEPVDSCRVLNCSKLMNNKDLKTYSFLQYSFVFF